LTLCTFKQKNIPTGFAAYSEGLSGNVQQKEVSIRLAKADSYKYIDWRKANRPILPNLEVGRLRHFIT
jgi:hypothetical protein